MTVIDCKQCRRCHATKTIDQFPPSKKNADGLFSYCRVCKRASDRASHAKHREARSASQAARYAVNPEPAKARSRARYNADPARWKAEAVAWVKANPEKKRAASSAWQKRNPDIRRENVRRRYARRKGAVAVIFTKAQLEQRMAYWGNRCWLCGGPRQSIDHVKPLSKGGAHMLCNLRPVCWTCNSSKSDKWPVSTAART